MMKVICALMICLSAGVASAQTEIYRTDRGVVLLSKTEGQDFTLKLDGKEIRMFRDGEALPNLDGKEIQVFHSGEPLIFSVDGRFVQVTVASYKYFGGRETDSDKAVLRKQMGYEADFLKQSLSTIHTDLRKLPTGLTVLCWSFTPTITKSAPQVYVSFHGKGYVVFLSSPIFGADTQEAVEKFSLQIVETFHPSDHPLKLHTFPDGHYDWL